jgi:hypothetical protein
MAYSNWGAFVFCNGSRREDKEDVGVFDTEEGNVPSGSRIWTNLAKNISRYPSADQIPWHEHSHHAVLGDGKVRLCGYKNMPELWILRGDVPERVKLPTDRTSTGNSLDGIPEKGTIKVDGLEWQWWFLMYDGNMIDLKLFEPDGTVWDCTCGFEYGAGWED